MANYSKILFDKISNSLLGRRPILPTCLLGVNKLFSIHCNLICLGGREIAKGNVESFCALFLWQSSCEMQGDVAWFTSLLKVMFGSGVLCWVSSVFKLCLDPQLLSWTIWAKISGLGFCAKFSWTSNYGYPFQRQADFRQKKKVYEIL